MTLAGAGRGAVSSPTLVLTDPRFAVVIPVYKQPHFLKDSVLSALRQAESASTRVVIVNDGCPYPGTHQVARALATAHPHQVHYLRKPNGGLSSARNHGIGFALDAWPSVQAIFPLDADNRLSPHTLTMLWAALEANPGAAWAWNDLQFFGGRNELWSEALEWSVYRLLYDNFSDAGALIRRDVFDAGFWYDETLLKGYEDWELNIRMALSGRRGVHVPGAGFMYRRREHSMLSEAYTEHDDLLESIESRHPAAYERDALVALEHSELPRFALIDIEDGADSAAQLFTSPTWLDPSRVEVSELVRRIVSYPWEVTPQAAYIPPVFIFCAPGDWERLCDLRLAPGLLHEAQRVLQHSDMCVLTASADASPAAYRVTAPKGTDSLDPVIGLAVRSQSLIGVAGGWAPKFRTWERALRRKGWAHVSIGSDWGPAPTHQREAIVAAFERMVDAVMAGRRLPAPAPGPVTAILSHTAFSAWTKIENDRGPLPVANGSGNPDVFFVLPWLGLGGTDLCVLNLARELRRAAVPINLHLVLTVTGQVETDPGQEFPFESVTFVPEAQEAAVDRLAAALQGADVMVNCHSTLGYRALPQVRRRGRTRVINYLHLVDQAQSGMPVGHTMLATRRYEYLTDAFAVISAHLRRTCVNLGVPSEKIRVIENAPVVRPLSPEVGLALARTKSNRRFTPQRPLRMLFAGRFDHQKGIDRLRSILAELHRRELPVQLDMVGRATLDATGNLVVEGAREAPVPGAVVHPATHDPAVLSRLYTHADVLLMPSRWEGLSLAMLDAMAHGTVVIATDVGSTREAIQNAENGFIVYHEQAEANILGQFCNLVEEVTTRPDLFTRVREGATRTAMARSWEASGHELARLLEELTQ